MRRLRRCNATTEIFRPLNILTNQGTKNIICVPGFKSVVQPYLHGTYMYIISCDLELGGRVKVKSEDTDTRVQVQDKSVLVLVLALCFMLLNK